MSTGLSRLALLCLSFQAGCAAARSGGSALTPLEFTPEPAGPEGEAHGFPALRTAAGEMLADGDFTQRLDDGRLEIRIRYDFGQDHWIEERSVIQQEPTLVQERWSWAEMRAGVLQRRFELDFLTGRATAAKLEEGELQRWSEDVEVEPGRAFAGAAWALVLKSVRSRLLRGEKIEFQTVGFTPKPATAAVELSHAGLDRLAIAGRTLTGDRFRIHPKIPWFAKLFVDVPDSWIWLANPPPAAFLRFEGPLAEPGDPMVRVDLFPGEPSEAASPVVQ
jgi:hypothetical protein